jgi:hypothetical protein
LLLAMFIAGKLSSRSFPTSSTGTARIPISIRRAEW